MNNRETTSRMLNMAVNSVVSNRWWKSDSDIDLSSSDSLSDAHVLAVDDSIIDRKVIEKLLKTTSCKVTAVDSGLRALEFLGLNEEQRNTVVNDLKVDLIITDYCMPGMTGYDLLKRIKNSSTFKETPVVIMSSENVRARIDRCLEEGAEAFIVKPVKSADVKRLRDYMSREDRSKLRESGINKRKQRDSSSDFSSESPSSRSPSSDSSMSSPDTQSSLSISSSPSPFPSPSMASQSPSSSPPSSPSGLLDSLTSPSSLPEPLDCTSSPSQSEPLDSQTTKIKITIPDEIEVLDES